MSKDQFLVIHARFIKLIKKKENSVANVGKNVPDLTEISGIFRHFEFCCLGWGHQTLVSHFEMFYQLNDSVVDNKI